jgi:tripartite-type tricarboxylate transporter receptor subunit TctC
MTRCATSRRSRTCSKQKACCRAPFGSAQTVPELIGLLRAKPGAMTYASAGMGTASHLAGELFKVLAKVEMVHVPYKGNVPAITDLLAGQTSLLFATMPTVLPHAKAGKLRALATIGAARSAAAPELPTVGEALPGFECQQLDRPVRSGRNAAGNRAALELGSPCGRCIRADPRRGFPRKVRASSRLRRSSFGAFVKAEIAKWAPVVKASGARVE